MARTRLNKNQNNLITNVQTISTNSAPAGLFMQAGWGFINASGSTVSTSSVTFPVAFSNLYSVVCIPVGLKTGADPTSIGDTAAGVFGGTIQPVSSTTSGFTATAFQSSAPPTGLRMLFSWIAIGN